MINKKKLQEFREKRIILRERAEIYKDEAQWALDNAGKCISEGDYEAADWYHALAHRYNMALHKVNEDLEAGIREMKHILVEEGVL